MSDYDKKKILILVEGEKTDVALMQKLLSIYDISSKYEIVSYGTNIYVLYQEMFRDGVDGFENIDLLQVLKSREKDPLRKKIFDDKYTDILLIFDLDPQDPQFDAKHIQLMQDFFVESSDMGKLYLNYPMVEAFYHLSAIPDKDFLERKAYTIELREKAYKARVQKESKGNDYRKFAINKEQCSTVILQHLAKALFIVTEKVVNWEIVLQALRSVELGIILDRQLYFLKNEGFVYVLSTCIFYIIDYNPRLLYSPINNENEAIHNTEQESL